MLALYFQSIINTMEKSFCTVIDFPVSIQYRDTDILHITTLFLYLLQQCRTVAVKTSTSIQTTVQILNRRITYSAELMALINSASALVEVVEFTVSTDAFNRRTSMCICWCETRTRTSAGASHTAAAARLFLTASGQSFIMAEAVESF